MISRRQFEYHPVIGYRFVPNLKARIPFENGGYLVRANNSGFRCNHDFVAQRRPGLRRILLFGDSYTAGEGISNEQRFGDLLEKKLSNLEVYNFGLPGTCTGQQYLTYKEYATDIEHDLLIIGVYIQNIWRTVAHYRYFLRDLQGEEALYAKPYFELANGKLLLKGVPPSPEPIREEDLPKNERGSVERPTLDRLKKLLIKTKAEKLALKLAFNWDPFPEYNSPSNPEWQLMRAILEEWICNHPKPVLLMPIPAFIYVEELKDPSNYQARFHELVEVATNCTLHDPLPRLLNHSFDKRRTFRFRIDNHLSAEGHLALADSMVPVVEDLLNEQR